ncbi:hypothetical protein SAMN05444339_10263 [Loktanella atrilutea]|uniref:Phage DNA packaging protein, Nu1 subunit of terminase n=1 Tax=Loktanella atrilutea TaxID=366533 RepID=A0A1M4WC10_LOKAT|nr:hypothetical protein [Loktanella atrilutea]SHE78784.1 hypothetical protein SAMN05444339_10263 [Loktanella atrilutea]
MADLPKTITQTQAAELVGMTTRWVRLRATDGFFQRSARGVYDLHQLVRGIVAYYESLLEKGNKAASANRASDARTREVELRIAEREGRLIPSEDAAAVVADLAALVLSEMSGLAARVTRDLDLRRKIEAETDGVIDRIRARAEGRAVALRAGIVDLDEE